MSQSGALCTSILDMALGQGIGFSRFYSIGNKADLNEMDLLKAWADDPETRVIVAYLEGITNGPEFIRVAREVTRHKPIIAIKSGTTSAGSQAVSSHTGTLAGSEAAYDAAFKQCGIIRAGSVQDLFDYAQAFARQPLLEGDADRRRHQRRRPRHHGLRRHRARRPAPGLADARDQAGPAGRCCPPRPASPTRSTCWAMRRPTATPWRIEAALNDPERQRACCWSLTPQTSTQIPETAEALGKLSQQYGKPVFGAFMGDAAIRQGVEILRSLRRAQLPGARAGRGGHRRHVAAPPVAEHAAAGSRGARRRPRQGDARCSPRCAPTAA